MSLTRNLNIITILKCGACDHELKPFEIEYYDGLDGMCEGCYSESMNSVYEDDNWMIE